MASGPVSGRLSLSQRLLLMVALSLLASLATVGLAKALLDACLPGPAWLQKAVRYRVAAPEPAGGAASAGPVYDLGRFSRRYLLVVTLAVGLALRRWVPWRDLLRRGFRWSRRSAGEVLAGLSAALAMLGLYVLVVQLSGFALWTPDPPGYVLAKAVDYAAVAVAVALAEEAFFRGLLFRALVRDWGPCRAVVTAGAVYGVLHCISGVLQVSPGWDPAVGLDLLRAYFTDASGSVLPDLRLAVGLFLLGCLLSYLYLRTGSLWLAVGLHGGVVFASKLLKKYLSQPEGFPHWLLGDRQFVLSGVACWLLLAAAIFAATRLAPRGPLYRRLARRETAARAADEP